MKKTLVNFVLTVEKSHKYVKREGTPGNYKYFYRLPDGSIGTRKDLNAAKKKTKDRGDWGKCEDWLTDYFTKNPNADPAQGIKAMRAVQLDGKLPKFGFSIEDAERCKKLAKEKPQSSAITVKPTVITNIQNRLMEQTNLNAEQAEEATKRLMEIRSKTGENVKAAQIKIIVNDAKKTRASSEFGGLKNGESMNYKGLRIERVNNGISVRVPGHKFEKIAAGTYYDEKNQGRAIQWAKEDIDAGKYEKELNEVKPKQ
ncbi:MAG: hypothetical protein FWB73_00340 [Treponema sp.]|nr:hypothetical protein [Treponema sp.]